MNNMSTPTDNQQVVLVMPHNQRVFKYKINDGSFHSIRKEKIVAYLQEFINIQQRRIIIDFIARFRPFVIIDGEAIELTKSDKIETLDRKHIDSLSDSALEIYARESKENNSNKSNRGGIPIDIPYLFEESERIVDKK